MNTLQAGFSKINVTPKLGCSINGYFIPRFAEGVLDDLHARTLALACADTKVALVSIDNLGIKRETLLPMLQRISQETGLPVEMWDERRTTVEAHNILSEHNYHGKKRKDTVDAVAAALILEGYLAFKKR